MNRFVTLKKRSDFLRIRENGKSVVTKHLLISWVKEKRGLQIGVSITKKIDKRSARRNRLRRRLKEILRQELPALSFDGGLTLVIVARNGAAELEFKTLRDEFEKIVRKAGLLTC